MKNTIKIRERDIEQYLKRQVEKIGGLAYKFSSPGNRAVPDRVCLFKGGETVFVECKAPGKKPTPLQRQVIRKIRLLGHDVLVIDTKEMVDIFIESIQEVLNEQ
jgi:hypothetical protein